MQTVKINKWGNSLGLRLPKHITDAMGIEEGCELQILSVDQGVLLQRIETPADQLEALLEQVTEDNLHHEPWGEPVGEEIW